VKFLFCSLESPGFLYPAIGLARALLRRGHEVAFASDQQTAEELNNLGLMRVPRGDSEGSSFLVARWANPAWVAIQVKHIEYALQEFQADALVGQSLTLGPLIVGERRNLPVGLLGFCTYLWPLPGAAESVRNHPRDEARLAWRHQDMLNYLNQARSLFRLPLHREDLRESPLLGDLFLLRSVPELETDCHLLPERVHLVGSCLWEPDLVDAELRSLLAASDASGEPVVYVQHGRFFHVPSFWPKLIQALGELPLRVVASSGKLDSEVGALPMNFLVRSHIPQRQVLRRASAVVASANTTAVLGALAAGLPSLLIPAGGEQPDVAELCESAGTAKILDPKNVTAKRIRASVEELLTDCRYRRRAANYASAFSKVNGLEVAANLVEMLAATRKPVCRNISDDPSHSSLANRISTAASVLPRK
jgi:UDP:flavonoid glycosyltransferase YjiC (YdhE family)